MFIAELVFGSIIPLVMLLNKRVLRSPLLLFIASSLVIFGVLLNRIDNFIVAYKPPYATAAYFPSFGEISVTCGMCGNAHSALQSMRNGIPGHYAWNRTTFNKDFA